MPVGLGLSNGLRRQFLPKVPLPQTGLLYGFDFKGVTGQLIPDIKSKRNLIPNSAGYGGTASTLPTGWITQVEGAVTATVTAMRVSTVVPGAYEYDITYVSTDANGTIQRLFFTPAPGIAKSNPQVAVNYNLSFYTAVSDTVSGAYVTLYHKNAANQYQTETGYGIPITSTLTRFDRSHYSNNVNVTHLHPLIYFFMPGNSTRVLTILAPQFELGTVATSYQWTIPGAVNGTTTGVESSDAAITTQGATFSTGDVVTLPLIPASTGEDTFVFTVPPASAAIQTIYNSSVQPPDGTTPYIWIFRDTNAYLNGPLWVQMATGTANAVITPVNAAEIGTQDVFILSVNNATGIITVYKNGTFLRTVSLGSAVLNYPAAPAYIGAYQSQFNTLSNFTLPFFFHYAGGVDATKAAQLNRYAQRVKLSRGL